MTDSQRPAHDSSAATHAGADPARRRKRRMIAIGAISAGAVALVVILVVALGGSDDTINAQGGETSTPAAAATVASVASVASVSEATTTTVAPAATSSTAAPTSTEAATTTSAPTTTVAATTTAAATTVPAAPPPVTTPVTPATAATVGNCTVVGAISIPKTNTLQTILAETQQYTDGLLCGNHKSDGVAEGVDVLPGMAPFETSVEGGPQLVGQIPAIIFGHRNSHNHPFRNIDKLQPGDAVSIIHLDGSTIELEVDSVVLLPLAEATNQLLAPSTDGAPQIRLVACSHADGSPGGVNYRWVATLTAVG